MPEPVGPVTSSAPVGRARMWPICSCIASDRPRAASVGNLARLVEQAHRHRLAFDRRQRGDADVEQAPGGRGAQRDAAVLRLAALGDVELREHLQAGRDAGRESLRDPLRDVQHTVDAVADDQLFFLRLDVNVAGTVLGSGEDERVDEANERRVGDAVVGFEIVLVLVEARHVADEGRVHRLGGAREPADLGQHVVLRGDEELDRLPRREAQLVEPAHVLRVGDRDLEVAAVGGERDRADALEHGQGDDLRGLRIDAGDGEVDERQLVLLGQPARHAERACEPLVDQRLRERPVGAGRALLHLVDPLGRKQAGLADHVGDDVAVAAAASSGAPCPPALPHRRRAAGLAGCRGSRTTPLQQA